MKKIISFLFFCILIPSISWATISRIGSPSYTFSSGSGTWIHVLSQSPTAGDLLVVAVTTQDGCANTTTATVTDSASNSLTKAASNTGNGGSSGADPYIFYEIVPSGLTTSISITTTISGGGGCNNPFPAASGAEEYSGASSTVDTTAVGTTGFSSALPLSWNTSSVSVTAGDLTVGLATDSNGATGTAYTTGTGWNQLENNPTNTPAFVFSDQINVSSGSYAYNGTYNNTPGGGSRINSVFASFLGGSTPPPPASPGGIVNSGQVKGGII